MKLFDFVNNYNLLEVDLINIKNVNHDLYLTLRMDIESHYIANGCRPEFDYQVTHLFIFKNASQELVDNNQQILDYQYANDKLTLKLSKQTIMINDCEIDVIPNVE